MVIFHRCVNVYQRVDKTLIALVQAVYFITESVQIEMVEMELMGPVFCPRDQSIDLRNVPSGKLT
jgi:hypothetical protein